MTKQQLLTQLGRFARLAGTAFIASGIVQQVVTGHANQAMVVSAAVGAIEVAYRAIRPTVSSDQVEKAVLSHLSSLLRHSLHVHAMPDPRVPVAGDVEGGGTASAGAIPPVVSNMTAAAPPVEVTTVAAPAPVSPPVTPPSSPSVAPAAPSPAAGAPAVPPAPQ